jgi:hypothetical protein
MSDEVSSKHGCAFFKLEGYARLDFRKEFDRPTIVAVGGWGGMTAGHNNTRWGG